ncbi:MAG TPA: FAD-dependent oxidoreductase [Candidatus Flavonifractor merdigallinarum]|uniref:FAD-dependent oxidoreductase n=1 Tax=Candidatus Flavonifractor merdigallinarum TaxID=2838589 RepID=A0A9D1Y9I6_9FIRM|nr:FAD-dependent oxidoreductase [Candidatus Flavonifractor merdigallinarum]
MKVLVIGGVAAGTKTAAKLKRMDRSIQVTLITRDQDISYAGCGLPYYVGGLIETREQLIVNTPQKYAALTGVEVFTGREAVALDSAAQTVTVRHVDTGEEEVVSYDACVIATGASPVVPPLPGMDLTGVFKLRTPDDAIALRDYLTTRQAKRAVVVGGGFIGLEAAENLKAQGLSVTVVDMADQILPNILDSELAGYVKRRLQAAGIRVLTGNPLQAMLGQGRVDAVQTAQGTLAADVVVLSIGIKPNTAFLNGSGMELFKGTIVVDEQLRTNLPHVYAAGDCALVKNRLTGAPMWSAMGSSANYEGRVLGQVLGGGSARYPGALGTGVVKLPGLNVGRTGLTEAAARAAGYDVETVTCVTDDKAHYYPGAGSFITKLVTDRATHKLLGIQVLGQGAVDKMVDIAVTGISMGAALEDFDSLDYAYAPPFSTAIHPFVQAVDILLNKLSGTLESITPQQFLAGAAEGYTVLDVALQPAIPGAEYINLPAVTAPLPGHPLDEKLLLVCNKGKRGYFLQNRLKALGYTNTRVLEGGVTVNEVRLAGVKVSLTPEQVAGVKALGFLWDKRTPDCFNARVITRNGKITAEEQRAVAEAAERFGSGEVTMTSRLTLEIQGVPYANVEPLRAFLAEHGLMTGGTGSKVRPVVCCKGTTCQYGLIDTFDLSQEIHERFFLGYNSVKLPHKFKIAVGGCPNNCVKPDLNDLGIVGQRVPEVSLDLCKGCKVCQVEESCPIHVARVENGKVVIPTESCNHCGRCVGKCPFHVIDRFTNGYKVYIGGRWGKKVAHGQPLEKIFTTREEVLDVVEKAILLFREQGITGERFADTIARLGFDAVQAQLLSDALLERKAENLAAQKHLTGGATC